MYTSSIPCVVNPPSKSPASVKNSISTYGYLPVVDNSLFFAFSETQACVNFLINSLICVYYFRMENTITVPNLQKFLKKSISNSNA